MKINKIDIFTRIFYMSFFALVFVVMGRFLPEIYYKNFDKTVYYEIYSAKVDKTEYKQGDEIAIEFNRNSLVNTGATAFIELVLVSEDNKNYEILSEVKPLSLDNDPPNQIIYTYFKLKEKVPAGNYFLRGNIFFRANDLDKNAKFCTKKFKIIN